MEYEVFTKIDEMMKAKGKKHQDLLAYLGLTKSTYDNWRKGTSKSYMKYIDRICEYLNIEREYLIGDIKNLIIPSDIGNNDRESELLYLFRKASINIQDAVLTLLKGNTLMSE